MRRRLRVSIPVWQKLRAMKGAGQTYDNLLEDMIEQVRKIQLEEDLDMWENRPDSEYVSLHE
ncbi:hypothetical protein [uncultured Methanoregula sp.]|uniref:hypothetical protein n=1 Tax=uncultured Methanoregula sp. TaxID=1005933 RepID=UPI00374A43EB